MIITTLRSKLTYLLLATLLVVPLLAAGLAPLPAFAVLDSKSAACDGVNIAGGNCDGAAASTKVSSLVSDIVNLLSVIVGIAAVIMVIVAGFKYVTSGGEANKVASAKSTLIYAIVGLIIVALAQFIVHFVLSKV
jgi:hypothetical protein